MTPRLPALPLIDPGLVMAASNDRLSSLRRLIVSGCPGVGDNGLRAVLVGCLALRELSAGGCAGVSSGSENYPKTSPYL